jgi:hypothetical protein
VTPGDYLGDVIGDINRRRGSIQDQLERGTNIAVVATVPLSEMFGYIGQLRGMTSGRASYTMEFSHYEPVPRKVADEVIARTYVRYLKWLTLALLSYVAVIFTVHVQWGGGVRACLLPRLNLDHDTITMIVAVFGTTISPYLFFWQAAQEMEDLRAVTGRSGGGSCCRTPRRSRAGKCGAYAGTPMWAWVFPT